MESLTYLTPHGTTRLSFLAVGIRIRQHVFHKTYKQLQWKDPKQALRGTTLSGNHIDEYENRYICAWLLEVEAAAVTSWRVLFVIPSQNITKLLGFTMNDDLIVEVDSGQEMVHTLQVYDRLSQQFHNVGIEGDGGSFFIAFACRCGAGDVVLRESYQPKIRGKLYYACLKSKPRQNYYGCKFFLWKEERVVLLISSPGGSSTPSFSPGTSSTPKSVLYI
ncbi:hypothetical protein Tco_0922859 [Tanacetum coccineum]|uniref:GRF-type domain-containing protein n=1 Tax=Tanacetum coccineum TaxID=301880 RepID=A0ABQ5D0I6_9ASTR